MSLELDAIDNISGLIQDREEDIQEIEREIIYLKQTRRMLREKFKKDMVGK